MGINELIEKIVATSSDLTSGVMALVEELKANGFVDQAAGLQDTCPIKALQTLEDTVKALKDTESYKVYKITEVDSVEGEDPQEDITEDQWEAAIVEIANLRAPDKEVEEPEEITESDSIIKQVLQYVGAPSRLYEALYAGNQQVCKSYLKRYGVQL